MLAPVLDDIASEYDGKVKIGKVNVENEQTLAAQYRINSIPALLVFKNGQVSEEIRGFSGGTKVLIKKSLDKAIA